MAIDENIIEGLQDEQDDKQIFILGTDITKIPCFKDSFLTGIYAGFGCGIASFLATSRVLQSTNISILSFALVTYGYWFNCRMKWAKDSFNCRQAEGTFAEEIEMIKSRKTKQDNRRPLTSIQIHLDWLV
ncbi:LOW QUALITY PROTEIN: cytochrome c oxidase assembly factor COX20 lethal (3) 87Df [Dermatophagoides pteronyssinus]|uniref:LOW QUALITY PROTEIN: cytochrome c oxidase assembly factor COX20 lethal (3) 87Df n=1 Tax=Dermatophagoides pteronyssinus TaxID=6956 RepID=UPI003F671B60